LYVLVHPAGEKEHTWDLCKRRISSALSVVFFAPQGKKNDRQKKKSTMLPQAQVL